MLLELTATPSSPILVYYCKADLRTGQTVRISQDGRTWKTTSVQISEAWGSMMHGNAVGRAKRSGARCVLCLNSGAIKCAAEPLP